MTAHSTAVAVMRESTPLDPSVDYINTEVSGYSALDGKSNAYQAVAQAASQAVQDARESLQNTASMASAVEAVAEKLMAKHLAAQEYKDATQIAAFLAKFMGPTGPKALQAKSLAEIGGIAKTIAKEFPSGA